MQTVSLIIPNWNGREILGTCLDAVRLQSLVPHEVIVVDNGSTDGSEEFIRQNYPEVHLILLGVNIGFAGAVNRGIEWATGIYIALLNNDTEPDRDWLKALVTRLESSPESGSAACKMVDFFDHSLLDGAGDILSRVGLPVTRGFGEPNDGRYSLADEVFGPCAGACVYRREVLNRIGLFDEDFVSYYEDADLAFRAQMAGYRCLYAPDAVCLHHRGATSKRLGRYATRMQERNMVALYVKNFPLFLLLPLVPLILAGRVRHLYRGARDGYGVTLLRGWLDGILILPRAAAKRRNVQRMRTVPLYTLRAWFGK